MTKEIGHYKSYEGLEFMEFTSIHCPSFVGASYIRCKYASLLQLQEDVITATHRSDFTLIVRIWPKIWAYLYA